MCIRDRKYPYEVFSAPGEPDLEWRRRNTYKKFYVQYDPYDMSSVRLLYKTNDIEQYLQSMREQKQGTADAEDSV